MDTSSHLTDSPPKADVLFSRYEPRGWFGRIRDFPLVRLIIGAIFLLPVTAGNIAVVYGVIEHLPEPWDQVVDIVRMIANFFALVYLWRLFCRTIEKREPYELSGRLALPEFALGVLIAASIIGTTVFVFHTLGIYRIEAYNGWLILAWSFVLYLSGSLMQELVTRLLIFRLLEEWLGSWAAIAIASVIFGLVHAANPNQTALSTFTLIISSFVLIGPFMLTRRVWMVLGVHFGWNFLQTGVFGMPNSGLPIPGWITSVVEGPNWLTGGAVGVENSVITVGLSLVVSFVLLALVIKRDQICPPSWNR